MSVSPPALAVTLGRGAYRWPLRTGLAALTVGLAAALSALSPPIYLMAAGCGNRGAAG